MGTNRSSAARLAALLAALLLPSGAARAGGFSIPLIGARMSGRQAFVGYPDDTSAIYHNPAGLTLLRGYRFDLSAIGIVSGTRYQRYEGYTYDPATQISTAHHGAPLSDSVKPESPFGVLPFLGFSGDFGLEKFRFGLGIYSPHNATGAFPADGPQRYQVTKGTIFTLFVMPTVAWEPIPQLSIGAQIGPTFAKIGYERAQQLLTADGLVKLDASAWTFAFGFGVLFRPIPRLSIGASYASQTKFPFRGDISVHDFPAGSLEDPNATSASSPGGGDFRFPRMIRLGVNYRFPRWDFGVDFTWYNYAVYDAIRLKLDNPLTIKVLGNDQTIDNLEEPKESKNSYSLAVGGRFSPLPELDLRAGMMYDKSPYPDTTYTILNPDHDKAGFALGATYRFRFGLDVTLAYVHLFYFDRTIDETKVCQRATLGTLEACLADTEAGGEVHGKMVIVVGLQAGYSF